MDHLDAIENLRQGIGLRGYGQKDPLVEYKNEAFEMFEQLINAIDDEIVHRIYKIQVQQAPTVDTAHQHMVKQAAGSNIATEVSTGARGGSLTSSSGKLSGATRQPTRQESASGGKLGRNDPCWCGATKPDGTPKKYKQCHWPN